MANIKTIIAANLSQRQREINKQAERADLLDQDRLLCNIIRVSGNIDVPGRPGFVWCQEYSPSDDTSPFHAFNDKVQAREGLSVWVGPGLGGRREVLDWNNATIVNTADYAAQKYLPVHHSDHEWPDFKPGPDVVNVYPRSLTMLRAYPGEAGGLTVSVAPLRYIKDGSLVTFPGKNSLDISASQPASGLARFVGLYLDWDDNTIKSVDGATTSDSPAITPDSPTFPSSAILSVMVRMDGDQTTFSEVDFVDTRQVLSFTGPGAVQVSKIWESDFGAVAMLADADGNLLASASISADNFAFVAKNTSGAAAAANDVGYIDEAGEYKTTTTAQDKVSWGVVIVGGADDADIYVARRGRVTVAYTGTAPSSGDYLVTSTSAGDAQQQTTMHPAIFAIAIGAGAVGVVEVLLLTGRTSQPLTSDNDILFVASSNDSRFTATIAAAGVVGDKVYYTLVTGNVNSITPSATTELGKIILHNTTQTLEARVIDTGTDGTGDFIQVSVAGDISTWVSPDAIKTESTTNTAISGGARYFDIEMTGIPTLTTELKFVAQWGDTGAVGQRAFIHPFEANNNSKNVTIPSYLTTGRSLLIIETDLQQDRFCCAWDASGTATGTIIIRLRGVEVATP